MLRITSITCALVLTACALETADETEAVTTQAAIGCPTWGCGENSPVMGPFGNWWELHNPSPGTIGLPNNEGMQVIDFQIGAVHYRPEIVNGTELRAVHPNGTVVSGAALTGGYFNIHAPGYVQPFHIVITKVNPKASSVVTFWVGPATQIETYELFWTGPGGSGRVCEDAPGRSSGEQGGHHWVRPLEAIFFTGDRYDAEHKRVTHSDYPTTEGWFNIGCAGSVLAKLHLNRHTTAGKTGGWITTASQRQTLLKMYVSDVCGGGEAWTTSGTPLYFEQTSGWMQLGGGEFAVEAQWGPGGALCLDYHRKGTLYTSILNAPNIIQSSCPRGVLPPPCNQDPSDFSVASPPFLPGAYIVSAVPQFVP